MYNFRQKVLNLIVHYNEKNSEHYLKNIKIYYICAKTNLNSGNPIYDWRYWNYQSAFCFIFPVLLTILYFYKKSDYNKRLMMQN